MRFNSKKLTVASESISSSVNSSSDKEFQFPLVLIPESLNSEKDALDTAIEGTNLSKAAKEEISELAMNLYEAACSEARFCLNWRIVDERTGEVLESLFEENGRPTTRKEVWLNSFENGERISLGKVEIAKKSFKAHIEKAYQAYREEIGESAPSQDVENIDSADELIG